MGPLERGLWIIDQTTGFIGLMALLALSAVVGCLVFRRRFPHKLVWAYFVGWILLVSCWPYLRELDQSAPWFYALRGIPYGLALASMLSLSPSRRPAESTP